MALGPSIPPNGSELSEQTRELRRAAAVGQALLRARHDLNNLFHVATGWTRLLRDPSTGGDELREGVTAVLASSANVSQLIGGILALDGRATSTSTICDLATKLRELGRGLEYLLPTRGRLTLELPEQALVVCNVSEVRSAVLDFVLDIREHLANDQLRLGLYEAPDLLDGSAQRELVLERVPRLGANDDAEPRLRLRFPAEQQRVSPPIEPAPALPSVTTVLLVDGHRDVRRLATTMLDRAGYQVLTAQDAEQALETSRNYDGPIQILCCDADTSGLAAERLIAELSTARPGLRVLVCSWEQRLGKLDHYPRLSKPFSYHQLLNAVRACQDSEAIAPNTT